MSCYAGLYILRSPYHIDNVFDYFIPPQFRQTICVGDFVTVPFGNANKGEIALVISLKNSPEAKLAHYKPILSVFEKSFSLSQEAVELSLFMKEHTLCTIGEAVRCLIPSSLFTRPTEVYCVYEEPPKYKRADFDKPTLFVYDHIQKKGRTETEELLERFGPAVKPILKTLVDAGLIYRDVHIVEHSKKTESYYDLMIPLTRAAAIRDRTDEQIKLRSYSHLAVVDYFLQMGATRIREKELMETCGVSYAQLKALCDKGILERGYRIIDRGLEAMSPAVSTSSKELTLSEEQAKAFDTLKGLCDSGQPKAALLFGITGSGKTSVMLKTIDHVLSMGRSAIVLLPEISLTPQTLGIFCSRYGKRVAIIHSGLSEGERLDTYKRIKRGGADVVIGTRSAVFAPLDNIGLIVIDEEQEHTYKSDMNPKYHAKDIARFRCTHHNALMLLASATPSLESYHKAKQGKYTLVTLKNRYGNATLPKVTLVDLRSSLGGGALSPLSDELCKRLAQNKAKGGQSILFLNRRGYNSFYSCRSCGEPITCPTCSVTMTYHTTNRSYDRGELRCHWCGKRIPTPTRCEKCGSELLSGFGFGTQRVEQELEDLMPDAKILRMDTDTTSAKNSYSDLLGSFRSGEADILLGTQMVTKGHDFPNVTLVGVLNADSSLFLDDYRAFERTFSMLTQVVGRAGRSSRAGEAVIQTSNPDHECIRLACKQDYESFYAAEMHLRERLKFPPFCDIALLTVTSPEEKEVLKASEILSKELYSRVKGEYGDLPLIVYGPFEAPVFKVENRFRMRIVIKCKLSKRCRAMFSEVLKTFCKSKPNRITLSIDFNPSSL